MTRLHLPPPANEKLAEAQKAVEKKLPPRCPLCSSRWWGVYHVPEACPQRYRNITTRWTMNR